MSYVKNDETHARGELLVQLFHKWTGLAPFYSEFEKSYDPEPGLVWMRDTVGYTLPITAVVLYLLFCYFGQIYMKSREPFNLLGPLAVWNLSLSVFSAWGAMRCIPHVFFLLSEMTFEQSVCAPAYLNYGGGACGFAVQMFCLSKLPELIDTVFIVLRKKPLIFLHWYHHVTVLLFCWMSYVTESSSGIYFAAMNYTVHAVMYFYFFLQAIKKMPKWFPPILITFMQISQMIIGTFIVGITIYYFNKGTTTYDLGNGESTKCNNHYNNMVSGFIMYGSYLYLFVEFAVKRFIFGIKDGGYAKPVKGEKKTK
jgi:hypothetical protein